MLEEINEVTDVVEDVVDLVPTKSGSICKKVGIIGGVVAFVGLVTGGTIALVKRHKKKKKAYAVKDADTDDFYEEEDEFEDEETNEEEEETNKKSKKTKK